jgi:hypothetical protein
MAITSFESRSERQLCPPTADIPGGRGKGKFAPILLQKSVEGLLVS